MDDDNNFNNYPEHILLAALDAAYRAACAILEIYHAGTPSGIELKSDNSPLTTADRKSHEIICSALAEIPGQRSFSSVKDGPSSIPILSEEGKNIHYQERRQWKRFWLVDPLDGTKEFISRNGEFTVNIALVEKGRPVAGVVCVPVKSDIYFAAENIGSYKVRLVKDSGGDGGMHTIPGTAGMADRGCMDEEDFVSCLGMNSLAPIVKSSVRLPAVRQKDPDECYTVIASRSHMNRETEEYVCSLEKCHGRVRLVSAGSSLKICLVAEGAADCYPRLGPTMEWDTAAAHAVARYAGKRVIIFDSDTELVYNKENLLNPWFVVR